MTNSYFNNIPLELKQFTNWVNWGCGTTKDKKPFNPKSLTSAMANTPNTWGTYDEAVARVYRQEAQGIGFEFDGNGYIGVDLDNVIVDGALTTEAQKIVDILDSYTEISPSGKGVHIIVRANINLEQHRKELN